MVSISKTIESVDFDYYITINLLNAIYQTKSKCLLWIPHSTFSNKMKMLFRRMLILCLYWNDLASNPLPICFSSTLILQKYSHDLIENDSQLM